MSMVQDTPLVLGGHEFTSRFILGSGKYSLDLVKAAVENAGAQIVTLALRRANAQSANVLDHLPEGVTVLPNTSGAHTAEQAVQIARLAREMGLGDLVKIEVITDNRHLLPDNHETLKAVEALAALDFVPLPYMYPDVVVARQMAEAGAAAIMPLGSPIGSNRGLVTREFVELIIDAVDLPVIVDAGLGRPSEAALAMELGCAAVMANTAIATAGDVPAMARAFGQAIEAGRLAHLAGLGRVVTDHAVASSPLTGFLDDDPDRKEA
ncbi:thiazole synthase [Luteococcus sp.]|uniref:thiazole synthase n=1 Tax=Luteococcus sp. TaxID=1969402 RepID=UPI0037358121